MLEEHQDWYLAQTKPGSLDLAIRNLERQNLTTFVPRYKTTRRKRGQFDSTIQPLFPGYVFIGLDVGGGNINLVNNTRGIAKLVSFGNDPARVPNELIAELKTRFDGLGAEVPVESIAVGDSVKITHGPFVDLVAKVDLLPDDQRAWLLIDVLGRTSRLSLERSSLSPLQQ